MYVAVLLVALTASISVQPAAGAVALNDELRYTPWLVPPGSGSFPYEGLHNDLPKLLSVQNKDNWVSMFVFSRALKRWAINCIYSYLKYGQASNYIAAVTDERSLQECLRLRLPCYNASAAHGDFGRKDRTQEIQTYLTKGYSKVVWGKVVAMNAVMQLGYHVHFSDVDVIYLRPVYDSFDQFHKRYGNNVDMITMAEDSAVNLFNTGVFTIRSNPYTLKLMSDWLDPNRPSNYTSQQYLNLVLAYKSFVIVTNPTQARLAKNNGWAVLLLHPAQFRDGDVACAQRPEEFLADPCPPYRMYVHIICRYCWDEDKPGCKGGGVTSYRLWLVDQDGRPTYVDRKFRGNSTLPKHPFLPCEGPAWKNTHMGWHNNHPY